MSKEALIEKWRKAAGLRLSGTNDGQLTIPAKDLLDITSYLDTAMKEGVYLEVGAEAILSSMKQGKASNGESCDHSDYFLPTAFQRFAAACAKAWDLPTKQKEG